MLARTELGGVSVIAVLAVLALVGVGCAEHDPQHDVGKAPPSVSAYGEHTQALVSGALLSANGSYGADCLNHAGGMWTVLIDPDASADHEPLSVVQGNAACELTLTSLRTGAGASELHIASPPFVISDAYQAMSSSFLPGGATPLGFYVNAKLSAPGFASDFVLSILYSADARPGGSASRSALLRYDAQVVYNAAISYWRLDDNGQPVRDTFTDTTGVLLQNHTGELGASWTRYSSSSANAVITNLGRVRRNAAGQAAYYTSAISASADYTVSCDLSARSVLAEDQAGVIGRADPATDTYYRVAYAKDATPKARWELTKSVNGTSTLLGSFNQALNTVTTYKPALDMRGTTIRMLLSNVQRASVTDSAISAIGRAGILFGQPATTTVPTDTTGLHLDNLLTSVAARDAQGTNHGTYFGGVTMGAAGAIAGDANTAAVFDGVDDYVSVTRQIADDFSIEFWFKSTQGIGTSTQWYNGAGLVDAEMGGVTNDFGITLRSDGYLTAGVGNPDTTIVSTPGALNNNQWHHVVFTRARATGDLRLYVDGQPAGSATGGVQSLTAPTVINFGRVQTAINYYAGSLDEVAVYATVLSPERVLLHYQLGIVGS